MRQPASARCSIDSSRRARRVHGPAAAAEPAGGGLADARGAAGDQHRLRELAHRRSSIGSGEGFTSRPWVARSAWRQSRRRSLAGSPMRAVTFQAPGEVLVEEVPEPEAQAPGDAIVRIEATGVCGSDLHIYHGRVQIEPGFTIGHEYVGTVLAVGEDVTRRRRSATACSAAFRPRAGTAGSAAAAPFTSATPRVRSATARRSARSRARRPSGRSCRTPISRCARCRRG